MAIEIRCEVRAVEKRWQQGCGTEPITHAKAKKAMTKSTGMKNPYQVNALPFAEKSDRKV